MTAWEEEFGEERLADAVTRHRDRSAADIITELCDEVRAFAGDQPRYGDMTMVVLKVAPGGLDSLA